MRSPRACVLALVLAVVAPTACGGQGSASPDAAGSDAPVDIAADTAGIDAPVDGTAACDPAAQDCASGSECDFGCQGTTAVVACRPDNGSAANGAACSTTTMQCVKGSGCVTMPGGGPMCRRYCAGDGDCATAERCHNVSLGVACGGPATTLALHFCY